MPSEAILTLITRDLVKTLSLVRPPAYSSDLKPEPMSMAGNDLCDGRVIVAMADGNRAGGDGSADEALGHNEWRQIYYLVCYFGQSAASAKPIDERRNDAIADIEVVLTQEETSFQRGGYAMGTFINNTIRFDDEENRLAGLIVEVTVEYRYVRGQPYES